MGHRYRTATGHRLSPLTCIAALLEGESGITASEISRKFKVSPSTVFRWQKNWGFEVRKFAQRLEEQGGKSAEFVEFCEQVLTEQLRRERNDGKQPAPRKVDPVAVAGEVEMA